MISDASTIGLIIEQYWKYWQNDIFLHAFLGPLLVYGAGYVTLDVSSRKYQFMVSDIDTKTYHLGKIQRSYYWIYIWHSISQNLSGAFQYRSIIKALDLKLKLLIYQVKLILFNMIEFSSIQFPRQYRNLSECRG